MIRNYLAPKEKTGLSSVDKNSQLSDFITEFIISNIYNVFKVIYIKDCDSVENWQQNISDHVGGLLRNLYLKYNVEVITYVYSVQEQKYLPHTHTLENVEGFEVVDICFNKIKEASFCDMLAIRMIASKDLNPFLTIPGQNPNYHCCYLFARK